MSKSQDRDDTTIADFGEQWTRYTENHGYYASLGLLADIVGPLLEVDRIRGMRVAEIGSGTGRIVDMLVEAGASQVVAIEPSDAFEVLCANVAQHGPKIKLVRGRGDSIAVERDLDLIVSIGVLHHIEDPLPVVSAARQALRKGGRLVVWLYGREGNRQYLALVQPLRLVTRRLPHALLSALCWTLASAADFYATACRIVPLPLHQYMTKVYTRMSRRQRHLIIYDQLNPRYARYYTKDEAAALLTAAGFMNVRLHHRHGYSWTVCGER